VTLEPSAILLVAVLLLVKEAGVPIPVPGDLLVLGAGVAAASGATPPVPAAFLLIAATIAGGAIQFGLLRGPGRAAMLGLLARLGLDRARIERRASSVGRGPRAVALARMTPGVRVLAIPAAALTAMPARDVVLGVAAGNAVFVGGHFALGFVVGEPAVTVARTALGPVAAIVVVLAIVGIAGWWLLRRRRRAVAESALLPWADAACPVCLGLAAAGLPAEAAAG